MKPARFDIDLYQGDTFSLVLRVKKPDGTYTNLTGCTPKSQIRTTPEATDVLAEFTAAIADQSTLPGGVTLTLSAAQTSALNLTAKAVWDVQITYPDGLVATYLNGTVRLLREVTR